MNPKEILNNHWKKIFNIVLRDARNPDDVEDLSQEAFIYICSELQDEKKSRNIKNCNSWINRVTENFCKRYYKKKDLEIKRRVEVDIYGLKNEDEQHQPEKMFIKKETPHIKSLKYLNPEELESCKRSLEWIKKFYLLQRIVKSNLVKYIPIFRTLEILSAAKKKINFELGRLTKETAQKYKSINIKKRRIEYDVDLLKDPRFCLELEDEAKEKFKVGIHTGLDNLIEGTKSMIGVNLIFKELLHIFWFSSVIKEDFKDFIAHMPNMQVKPAKLTFMVWQRKFRKDKYTKLKQIKELLLAFKDDTKGTDKEFLFTSLKDSVTLDSLRIAFHRNNKKKKYRELADFIYQKSFIEKISPFSKPV